MKRGIGQQKSPVKSASALYWGKNPKRSKGYAVVYTCSSRGQVVSSWHLKKKNAVAALRKKTGLSPSARIVRVVP